VCHLVAHAAMWCNKQEQSFGFWTHLGIWLLLKAIRWSSWPSQSVFNTEHQVFPRHRASMSCCVKSRASLWDPCLLFICCLVYLNSWHVPSSSLGGRHTDGWIHASCKLLSCHLTGGVWASPPISAFRNSIYCLFGMGRYDWFPCSRPMWPFLRKQ